MNKNINERWLAWLAGIIDGEGCICIWEKVDTYKPRYSMFIHRRRPCEGKSKRRVGYQAKITITNTDIRMVEKVRKIVGCGKISCREGKGKWKTQYEFNIGRSEQVRDVLEAVYPWLVIKQSQAVTVLKFLATGVGSGKRISDENKELRAYFHRTLKEIKQNGDNQHMKSVYGM